MVIKKSPVINNSFPRQLHSNYEQFYNKQFLKNKDLFNSLFEKGQKPKIMVISCCDSRVVPELIFDSKPGELFVFRNIANLIPSYDEECQSFFQGIGAALEFAVNQLQVRHIIILGHQSCSGLEFFLKTRPTDYTSSFITNWISQINDNTDNKSRIQNRELEYLSVEYSLNNLSTYPFIQCGIKSKTLNLHGAYFSISDGMLLIKNPESGQFIPYS